MAASEGTPPREAHASPRRIRGAVLVLVLGCSRPPASSRQNPPAPAPASAPVSDAVAPTTDAASADVPTPLPFSSAGEARRGQTASLAGDALLRPFLGPLREHFGAGRGPFHVQQADLAGGRTALLVSRGADIDPVVLSVDRDVLVWSKPRPVAGIAAPVLHLAIAPRPDGGVVLFGYVAGLHLLAARMWTNDGNPFADIELASLDACDALSAAYAPGFGWVVVCSSRSGARAARLREEGTTAWGHEGIAVGPTTPLAAATLVFDAPSTWVMLARAKGAAADHLLAWRYDAQARALWAGPADVGALPPARRSANEDRLEASSLLGHGDGGVRIQLPRGLATRTVVAAEITSEGAVRWQPR